VYVPYGIIFSSLEVDFYRNICYNRSILHSKGVVFMTSKLKLTATTALAGATAAGVALMSTDVALGVTTTVQGGVEAARGADVPSVLLGDGGAVTTVVNTMLFIVGFLSVIMLIWGGLRYVVSGGNSNSVTAAKNTILYAIVGRIIALFAYAIVNFVIGSLTNGSMTGGTNV
jgi:hypothetical protein